MVMMKTVVILMMMMTMRLVRLLVVRRRKRRRRRRRICRSILLHLFLSFNRLFERSMQCPSEELFYAMDRNLDGRVSLADFKKFAHENREFQSWRKVASSYCSGYTRYIQ